MDLPAVDRSLDYYMISSDGLQLMDVNFLPVFLNGHFIALLYNISISFSTWTIMTENTVHVLRKHTRLTMHVISYYYLC